VKERSQLENERERKKEEGVKGGGGLSSTQVEKWERKCYGLASECTWVGGQKMFAT